MTQRLFNLILEQSRTELWFLAALLFCLCLPLVILLDVAGAIRGRWHERRLLRRDTAQCARGHAVTLRGAFRCTHCGLVSHRHFYTPCPYCRRRTTALLCRPPCSLPVLNPLDPELPGDDGTFDGRFLFQCKRTGCRRDFGFGMPALWILGGWSELS